MPVSFVYVSADTGAAHVQVRIGGQTVLSHRATHFAELAGKLAAEGYGDLQLVQLRDLDEVPAWQSE